MRHIKILFGVFLVLAGAALTVSAVAFAESGILPQPGTVSVTSTLGKLVSKNGLTVKDLTDEGTFTFESNKSGTFDLLFLDDTGPLGVKCTALEDTEAGSMLGSGDFQIVKGDISQSPGADVLLAVQELHFTCGGVLTVVRGRVVGKIEVNESTGAWATIFKQTGGVNELTSDETESGIILEASTGGGKFEQTGEETTDGGSLGVTSPKLMN